MVLLLHFGLFEFLKTGCNLVLLAVFPLLVDLGVHVHYELAHKFLLVLFAFGLLDEDLLLTVLVKLLVEHVERKVRALVALQDLVDVLFGYQPRNHQARLPRQHLHLRLPLSHLGRQFDQVVNEVSKNEQNARQDHQHRPQLEEALPPLRVRLAS